MSEPKRCSYEGCDRPFLAKGLCSTHYGRRKRAIAAEDRASRKPLPHQRPQVAMPNGGGKYEPQSLKQAQLEAERRILASIEASHVEQADRLRAEMAAGRRARR